MTHSPHSAVAAQARTTPCDALRPADSPGAVNLPPDAPNSSGGPAVSVATDPPSPKGDYDLLSIRPIGSVTPSLENQVLYKPVDPADPETVALADSIRRFGVLVPLLTTADGWIVSGHRRHRAARMAGLTELPCLSLPFEKDQNHAQFMSLLRECNRQRVKTLDEVLREEVAAASADPERAWDDLIDHRIEQSKAAMCAPEMEVHGTTHRKRISAAKLPFLRAIQEVLEEYRAYWPMSDRAIHYQLLNRPPLTHATKPASRYRNSPASYKRLVDLLTRGRLAGHIPMGAIADTTRPITLWAVHPGAQPFLREQIDGFLQNYYRDLLRSQPNHVELFVEKLTILPLVRPVAAEFTLTITTGKGYCSLPPRAALAERYRRSGKSHLTLLLLVDHDPDGAEIAQSLVRSLRDDFGIHSIDPVMVALRADQVKDWDLETDMTAKRSSSNYKKFVERHGHDVFELEAAPPELLQQALRETIRSVIDLEMFQREIEAEKRDAAFLAARRRTVLRLLGELTDVDDSDPDNQPLTEGETDARE